MADNYIRLEKVTVGYGGIPLIRDITLEIPRGQILTLIGPNGSGKSTILRSITRQLSLIGGAVFLDQTSLNQMSGRERSTQMAVVLTERTKAEMMTCYDVVAAGRYPYTGRFGILTQEDKHKVFEALQAVQAEALAGTLFQEISDGQKQRILLARAICQEPKVIVLDEPTSFLDLRHKLKLLTILKRMAKQEKITVILSLHEIELAQKISDRILCVKGDRIFYTGTPEEVFTGNRIQELYEIDEGSFDPLFGSVELPAVKGTPRVFVLAGGGTGIPVYRRLQREGVPFSTGILTVNDLDYPTAMRLAVQVIVQEPFQPVSSLAYEEALHTIKDCEQVIDAGKFSNSDNPLLKQILDAAKKAGKLQSETKGASV